LLHGAGIVTSRLLAIAFTFFIGSNVHAQETKISTADTSEESVTTESQTSTKGFVELEEMTITERADSQVGIADSASQGNVGQALSLRGRSRVVPRSDSAGRFHEALFA
jgi:hypothetical protein